MRRGIILAGGKGSRLHPTTKTISKQLLPVYDKPMIYYPLATLMKAGIKEVLIIVSNMMNQMLFADLLGTGSKLGMRIDYRIQESPNGIAEAFLIGEDFIDEGGVVLILGDNIFYGKELDDHLKYYMDIDESKTIFGCRVKDPSAYGVAVLDENLCLSDIVEKPKEHISDLAVPGLYIYDKSVVNKAKNLKPSERGELEITDLSKTYIKNKDDDLILVELKNTFWFDAGTHDSLLEASQFVKAVQDRTGNNIADLEQIAKDNGWV